jgi:hypothetical protein
VVGRAPSAPGSLDGGVSRLGSRRHWLLVKLAYLHGREKIHKLQFSNILNKWIKLSIKGVPIMDGKVYVPRIWV